MAHTPRTFGYGGLPTDVPLPGRKPAAPRCIYIVSHIYNPQICQTLNGLKCRKGSAEMIVLALLEARPRHGYELAKLIESQSESRLQFHVASLYPMLYRHGA